MKQSFIRIGLSYVSVKISVQQKLGCNYIILEGLEVRLIKYIIHLNTTIYKHQKSLLLPWSFVCRSAQVSVQKKLCSICAWVTIAFIQWWRRHKENMMRNWIFDQTWNSHNIFDQFLSCFYKQWFDSWLAVVSLYLWSFYLLQFPTLYFIFIFS